MRTLPEVEVAREIELLAIVGSELAEAAEAAGLDAPVPSCPDWTVRDLVCHVGMVHHWAATIVGEGRPGPSVDGTAAPEGGLIDWYRSGHAALIETLVRAPADVDCWQFLPSLSPLRFWTRRQLHETAIHRVDAGLANGELIEYDGDLAADGVDEIITKFLPRPVSKVHHGQPASIDVHATDAGRTWRVVIGPDTPVGREITRHDREQAPDCVVAGRASDLYLLLWKRRDRSDLSIDGDVDPLDALRDQLQVRWR